MNLTETGKVVLLVKNLPATAGDVRDAVQSLGQADPLEEEMATHSSILAWEIPWTESLAGYSQKGCTESDMTERLSTRNSAGEMEFTSKLFTREASLVAQ